MNNELVAICREVDKRSGKVVVYEIKGTVTYDLLFKLKMRAMLNPELRYFTTTRERWDSDMREVYYKALKKRNPDEKLEGLDGIKEVK